MIETLLGAVGGLVLGFCPGFLLGRLVSAYHPWRYWTLNLIALVAGIATNAYGLIHGEQWLSGAAVAFILAAFTGLKYGRGATVGRGSLDGPLLRDPGPPSLWDD